MKYLSLTTLIFCLGALFSGCSNPKDHFVHTEGEVWHTVYHITYEGPEALADSVVPLLENVGASVSAFDPKSTVSRINRSETDRVDSYFALVYNAARKVSESSRGAFDPTVEPLVAAWGFGRYDRPTSDTARIDSLLRFVGIAKTSLAEGKIIKSDPRISFDFSAIAKGFGCDEVGRMLRRNGVTNYLVEIGGEIAVCGTSPSGSKWAVSIDSPIDDAEGQNHSSACVIELTDCGLATSGNYRNFREIGGRRIAHTINAFTGYPAQTDVASATVIAPTCMLADAFATACMASSSAGAINMLTSEHLEGMLILTDGAIKTTAGFDKLIRKSSKGN